MLSSDPSHNLMPTPVGSAATNGMEAVVPAESQALATVPVLHLINGQYYAGAERVQDLLAKRLPAFGFSVGFACVKLDLFDEMRTSREAPLYDVPMLGRFDLVAAWRVADILKQGNYHLLHSHTVRSALIGCLASRITGVPIVHHVHSPARRDTHRPLMNRLNGWIERYTLRRASRLIAVSNAIADYLASEGFNRERIAVVPNGVPAVQPLPSHEKPTRTWTLGIMALFRPRKGIEVLLNALASLLRQGLTVQLRAIGGFESSQYEAEIAELANRLGVSRHITWTGFTNDVNRELQQTDILVLPSLFGEGMPMVVLEAMAAGIPIVATRVEGVPEAIRDGIDGVLATPDDPIDLARAIAAIIHGCYDWNVLRTNALDRHASLFSDVAMASGVANVYRQVLETANA